VKNLQDLQDLEDLEDLEYLEYLEEQIRSEHGSLTFEEIMKILEEELLDSKKDDPYLPLDFNDDNYRY